MRWLDSIKKAIGMRLRELSRAAEDRHCGHHSFLGSPGLGADPHNKNRNHIT